MKTKVLSHRGDYLNEKQQKIFTILCIGIVVSLIYWPLLNSILAIFTFAYWLFFLKKKFDLRSVKGYLTIIFSITYLLIVIGYFYSSNADEALFRIQQKVPLLIFPMIFGTIKFNGDEFLRRIIWSLSIVTVSGCAVCLFYGLYVYLNSGNI